MSEPQLDTEARITQLESALAHHQHEYDLLNQVVIDQANEISELRKRIALLEATMQRVNEKLPSGSERDTVEERPPHY